MLAAIHDILFDSVNVRSSLLLGILQEGGDPTLTFHHMQSSVVEAEWSRKWGRRFRPSGNTMWSSDEARRINKRARKQGKRR